MKLPAIVISLCALASIVAQAAVNGDKASALIRQNLGDGMTAPMITVVNVPVPAGKPVAMNTSNRYISKAGQAVKDYNSNDYYSASARNTAEKKAVQGFIAAGNAVIEQQDIDGSGDTAGAYDFTIRYISKGHFTANVKDYDSNDYYSASARNTAEKKAVQGFIAAGNAVIEQQDIDGSGDTAGAYDFTIRYISKS